jgi:uncharacterized protein YdeI (YjbR/CyaY-like superfamily)
MTENKNGIKTYFASTREKWRKWLEKNGSKEKSVWLIIHHKKSKTKSIYYAEAVEEALCFGWIDSKANKRDDESYYLYFTHRKPVSNWSKLNIERAENMIEQGKMREEGQKLIDIAKKSGKWKT